MIILADWAAIAIDNARLYASVERRRDHLERAVHGLDTTVAIAQALGGETNLDRILELIVKRARALVGARTLVIMLEQEDELVFAAGAGELPAHADGKRMPIEGRVTGQVLRSQRSERLTDARSALHISQELLGLEADTALLVPLAFRGRSVGVLGAFDHLADETGKLESTLYRLVQESVTNAIRHSGATRVKIDVTERDGSVDLAVTDDGRGFDAAARSAGFGLTGMRERVALAAGALEIETGATGTTVRARLPAHRRT